MNCAEWWSLFERAVAGAAQRMAATAIKLRQCLSLCNVICQSRRAGEDNDQNDDSDWHNLTLRQTYDLFSANFSACQEWIWLSCKPEVWQRLRDGLQL